MKLNWINTLPDGETTRKEFAFLPDKEGVENHVVNLYPEITFQTMEGFGGAITDAAGYVYSLMKEEQKHQLMETYFSPEQMKYGIVRIHMDSCDFSTEMYEAMSDPSDRELKTFSFSRTEKYILPMLADAENAAGKKLKLMLSPWSPPAFMKTNGERKHGGSLKPEYREFWADYICRYILEFRKRGYEVQRISLQNEPKAVQPWDSCIYTAREEKEFLRDFMYPALQKHDLCDVEVFIWDHNKERVYERVRDTVDETTKDMVAGVAFHWYSGDHFEALDLVRRQYPQLKMVVSESCIEYTKFGAADGVVNAGRLMKEGRANAVKLEGGVEFAPHIEAIVKSSIPVVAHIGLTPQSVNAFGGFKVQGKDVEAAKKLLADAKAVEAAGACMVVMECVPAKLAAKISEELTIPTIGIGAGAGCDGQVLVYQDLLAMYGDFRPKFVKVFANVGEVMREGVKAYIKETKEGTFPGEEHCFKIDDSVIEKLY